MGNPFAHFGGFLLAVWGHAFTLLAGCAITVVIGWIERHILKKQMPLWADLSILLAFIFFACFQGKRVVLAVLMGGCQSYVST